MGRHVIFERPTPPPPPEGYTTRERLLEDVGWDERQFAQIAALQFPEALRRKELQEDRRYSLAVYYRDDETRAWFDTVCAVLNPENLEGFSDTFVGPSSHIPISQVLLRLRWTVEQLDVAAKRLAFPRIATHQREGTITEEPRVERVVLRHEVALWCERMRVAAMALRFTPAASSVA